MVENITYFTYGKSDKTGEMAVLGAYGDLTPAQGKQYQQTVPLDPPEAGDALCVMRVEPEYFIVGHAKTRKDAPYCQYVRLPTAVLRGLRGDLTPLTTLFEQSLTPESVLSAPEAWTATTRQRAIESALAISGGEMARLFCLLQLALIPEGGWIQWQNTDKTRMLTLLQGITMLLPAPLRYYLTFSTNAHRLPPNRPRLIFATQENATTRTRWQWGEWDVVVPLTAGAVFMAHMHALWQGDIPAFIQHLETLDDIAEHMHTLDIGLAQNVDLVATRHALDLAVIAPDALVTIDSLLSHLQGENPPEGDLYLRYIERLFQTTLDERNSVAAVWLAQVLEEHAAIAKHLKAHIETSLAEQPDALYAFVRAYLNEKADPPALWLSRLHESARAALRMALESADPSIIGGWLQLLGREPLRYELGAILHEGLLSALPIAYQDEGLARDLLVIASKREPSTLPILLGDEQLLIILPDSLRLALLEGDLEALQALAETSRELFLLGVARVVYQEKTPKITPAIVAMIWDILLNKPNMVIAESYRPLTLIHALTTTHRATLQPTALENLLALMLADHQDELFYETAKELAQQEAFAPLLPNVLAASWRDNGDVLTLMGYLGAQNIISPQTAVNTFIALLNGRSWDDKENITLIEQLGRLIHLYADTRAPIGVLWQLADFANEQKHELIAKGVTKRLLAELSVQEDESQLVVDLQRLRKAIAPFSALKAVIKAWWRETVHAQSNATLQKLDRALEGNRALDDLHPVIMTVLGMRRALGNRTLEEWSNDINVTFRVLQALFDGLEETGKQDALELTAIRAEVDALLKGITPDLRQVLATNLKQLTHLIAMLADNRTKPSLIRGDDALERQFAAGEVTPQGAVDVMRWLAGYLEDSNQADKT